MLSEFDDGIHVLDSGFFRPRLDAIHLIVERGRVAVVDTGVNDSVPRVFEALAALGLAPDSVDWVVLTHVHLDHAGGAGLLMSRLPSARLLVHPRGARHMIDPSKLVAGTVAVYGEDAARKMYGEIVPVPAERVVEAPDGFAIELAGRRLEAIDTPGHAKHHLCLVDAKAGVVFAGDTFGLSYRELDQGDRQFVVPSTTPVQFDPLALHASIDRIAALRPRAVAVTHFGPVGDVPRLAADLHRQIDAMVAMARDCASRCTGASAAATASAEGPAAALRDCLREGMRELVFAEALRQGWDADESELQRIFTLDIGLNADGLAAWLVSGGR
ncbi:MBL fold metallo-hydrolase [Burkholderiaceae bacterium FT117]|uniref:MBL fold metallo-hydrolase n=1 Tax=Zeimonas sediminis TaxID=2944268 RepID=UPI002342F0CB|nr:MBL fold metallo-hydrolase [Zeimonas sediminis]MCM5569475.1 MBL fold metallo-hydrolase [Zeimonas sediminis]